MEKTVLGELGALEVSKLLLLYIERLFPYFILINSAVTMVIITNRKTRHKLMKTTMDGKMGEIDYQRTE